MTFCWLPLIIIWAIYFLILSEILSLEYLSNEGSYMGDLHIKPYFYCSCYVNGLVAGYLIEKRTWNFYKFKYAREILIFRKYSKSALLLLNIILSLQTITFDILPRISAIEASVFPTLMSIQLCIIILDESYFHILRTSLSLSFWKKLKEIIRVSYVFHPLTFEILGIFIPLNNFCLHSILFHIILIYSIHFIICRIIQNYIEKSFENLSIKISNKK